MNRKILFVCREAAGRAGFDLRTDEIVKKLRSSFSEKIAILSFNEYFKILDEKKSSFLYIFSKYPAQLIYLIIKKPSLIIIQRVNYHSFIPFIYALLWKVPFILDMDDWEFKEQIRRFLLITNSLSENLSRWMANKAACVICASHFLYNYYKKTASKIVLIPSGVDGKIFVAASKKNKQREIVWCGSLDIGRVEIFDGLKKFIEVFRCYKHLTYKLKIIAKGDLLHKLEDFLSQEPDSRIYLFKNISNDKVADLICNAKFGILPLFGRNKFFQSKSPVKVFEYMASGLFSLAGNGLETDYIFNEKIGKTFAKAEDMLKYISDSNYDYDSDYIKSFFLENYSSNYTVTLWHKTIKEIS